MYIFTWEQFNDLAQDILKELKCLFVAHAKVGLLVWLVCARQFGVGSECLLAVCGHLNLGDDGYVALCCVCNKFLYILLCVVAAVCAFAAFLNIFAVAKPPLLPDGRRTPCCKLGEAWVSLYLYAPAGSIGEVQVQAVHLEVRHCVNLLLYELLAKKVTADVEHQSTIGKLRLVGYCACGDGVSPIGKLLQCLRCVEKAGSRCCLYINFLPCDIDCISLGRCDVIDIVANLHCNAVDGGVLTGGLQNTVPGCKCIGNGTLVLAGGCNVESCPLAYGEMALCCLHILWNRQQAVA